MGLLLRRLAQNGPPAGVQAPSGVTGPPPGFTTPPGMTGPPPGLFDSTMYDAATATTAGFSIPSGASGPPPGLAPPPGVTGRPSGGFPPNMASNPGAKVPPFFMGPEGRDTLMGVSTMLLVLCLAAIGGRLISRRIIKQKLGSDDFFALGALLAFIALFVEQYLLALNGTGTIIASPKIRPVMGKLSLASQLTYNAVTFTARLSILCLYKRVFNLRKRWFRIAWWSCIGIVSLYAITLLTLNLTACAPNPISALWRNGRFCRFERTSVTVMGCVNAAIDLIILLLPIRMTWQLQMAKKQKIAVSSVFGLGAIGVAVSIGRGISIASPEIFQGGLVAFAVWSTTEPAVMLICACLPVMRPLFISIAKHMPSSSSWPTWSWSSRTRKPKDTEDSNSNKTLIHNNSASSKDLGQDSRGTGFGKSSYSQEMREDSCSKQSHAKMEPEIESREIKGPLPTYSPFPKSQNNHIGNYLKVATERRLAMQDLQKSSACEEKGRVRVVETIDSKWHGAERGQEEIRFGWE